LVFAGGNQVGAGHMDDGVGLLDKLVDGQGDDCAGDVVKVALQLGELGVDVIPQCRSHFDVVATDSNLHSSLLTCSVAWLLALDCLRGAGFAPRLSGLPAARVPLRLDGDRAVRPIVCAHWMAVSSWPHDTSQSCAV